MEPLAQPQGLNVYPLPMGLFCATSIPLWDTICKIAAVAAFPLKMLSKLFMKSAPTAQEPPGARGHLLLGSFPELVKRDYNFITFVSEYHNRYGKEAGICQVSLGSSVYYIVSDPKLMKEILDNPLSFPRGEDGLRIWREFSGPDALAEGQVAKSYRVQALNAIGLHLLGKYFPKMVTVADSWIARLDAVSEQGGAIDLMNETERATLATIGETLFKNDASKEAKNPFALNEENDARSQRFLHAFHKIFEVITSRLMSGLEHIPLIGSQLYRSLNAEQIKEYEEAKATLKRILEPIFREILEGDIKEGSSFKKLLDNFNIDPKNPDYKKLLDNSLGFLQASFETSSKALGWALYHLAKDQPLQNRLREELQCVLSDQTLESANQLKGATLLSQVLEETLRLAPPFPFLPRDIRNEERLRSFKLQKKSTILISPLLINRNEDYWEDPDAFKPERWKKLDDGDMTNDVWQTKHPEYSTFITGAHRCPGRHFAKQEIKVILAVLLLRFQIELVEDKPVEYKFQITLQPKNPIHVRLTRL